MKDHGPADGEDPRQEVGRRQREAADPSASVWVSANAGSGKTRVLVDRVARLLLAGAAPQKILCLTYTRAAAAEMQDRLFKTLGEWALADEPELKAILAGLDESQADLGKARRLFALALETPGGLRLQTIHAFCESVLRRFPAETGLSPRFAVLDEADHAAMRRAAAEAAVVELESSAEPEDQAAARRLLAEAELTATGDFGRSATLEALAKAAFGHRAAFEAESEPGAGARKALALAPGVSTESLWAEFARGLDRARLAEAAAHMLTHKKASTADQERGALLKAALEAADSASALSFLRALLLTQEERTPRKVLMTGPLGKERPDLLQLVTSLQNAFVDLSSRLDVCEAAARATDIARFARLLFGFYDEARSTRSALDFDDLITRTAALFDESPARAWALFKLDQGVDHILVDEAQDTSPPQWRVVDSLAEEFFAGVGARAPKRTIFAVGDEKQSIYSFQGADPRKFAEQRERFARLTREAPKPLKAIPLTHSFRSSPVILDLVDQVFASAEARKGLTTEDTVEHKAAFPDLAGRVEWWSACVKEKQEGRDPLWHQPTTPAVAESGPPDALLAQALAEQLKIWIRSGEPLAPGGRPIRPGDVLVLARNRGQFSRRLIGELKRLGLPVAGEDRIGLKAALSTRDLLAAARAALLPADSLSLAAVLRSPLFGFKEEDLIRLTDLSSETKPLRPGEPRPSLWASLTRRREEEPHWREAHRLLGDLMTRVDFLRPYEFFERILVEQDARRRLIGRLGPPASEPIDEFLAQALAYETGRAPTLQGFVRWMDGLDAEIKRDSAQAADEIRVMTVHGAKGLEAELVVVADPCKPADDHREPRLVRAPAVEGEGAGGEGGVFWLGSKEKGEASGVAAAREARLERLREEHRRLLYVALTRARTRLVVCGWRGEKVAVDAEGKAAESAFGAIGAEGSWHRAVWRAMAGWEKAGLARFAPLDAEDSPMRRLVVERGGRPKTEKAALSAAESAESSAARDARTASLSPAVWPVDWDQAPLAAEPAPLAPLAPSRLAIEAADPARPDSADGLLEPEPKPYEGSGLSRDQAVARGLALHRILERLASPATAPPPGPNETPDLFALAERLAAHPDLAEVFHPGAAAQVLSETPVFGPIRALGGRRIAGSIDRLIVTPERVLIVDFKTGTPPPPEAKIPRGHLTQMAAYAAAMSEIFPGRRLRAALLWIDGPRLDRLSAEEMRAALERLRERLTHGPFEPESEPLAALEEDVDADSGPNSGPNFGGA